MILNHAFGCCVCLAVGVRLYVCRAGFAFGSGWNFGCSKSNGNLVAEIDELEKAAKGEIGKCGAFECR